VRAYSEPVAHASAPSTIAIAARRSTASLESAVVSSVAETSGRLPRGWGHLAFQFVLWMGFGVTYQIARGAAGGDVLTAFENGEWIMRQQLALGTLFEPAVQRLVHDYTLLITVTAYTYWLSQFAVVGLTLLWVYLRRHDSFAGFRNWLIVANLGGLVGYVLVPTAPPRMFPEWGFVDTLAQYSSINHNSAIVSFASNPYAAMPSLHATGALVVGLVMAGLVRSRLAKALWLSWPAWVAFCVIATGNHYWLDVVAGFVLALLTGYALRRFRALRPQRA
jgi:membrane-associated phospholipid phosphatase